MNFSFDFEAPKIYPFGKKIPERSLNTHLDPLSADGKWFAGFKNRPSWRSISKDIEEKQAVLKNSKETKDNQRALSNSNVEAKYPPAKSLEKVEKNNQVEVKKELPP